MSKMEYFVNLSPLNTVVSRKVELFQLQSLSVKKVNISICNLQSEPKGPSLNRHSSHIVFTPITRLWLAKWCKIHKVYIHSHSMLLFLFTNIFIHIQQLNLYSGNILIHISRLFSYSRIYLLTFYAGIYGKYSFMLGICSTVTCIYPHSVIAWFNVHRLNSYVQKLILCAKWCKIHKKYIHSRITAHRI